MGADCCQAVDDTSLMELSVMPTKREFEEADWPADDEYIQKTVAERMIRSI